MPAKGSPNKRKAVSASARSKPPTLTFKQTVAVSPMEAFRAFTHATLLRDWFCNTSQVDARQGGVFYLGWESGRYVNGAYLTFDPGKKLVFTWHGKGDPEPTRVSVSFAARGNGTVVTVSHGGLGSGAKWAATLGGIQSGWTAGLENLKSVIETGVNLRYARRPRLGISIGEFNPEVAGRLGVPAKRGIKLEGTAEGTGARAAGLQKDDVVVRFGGKVAVDMGTLSRALEGRSAGEVVTVQFYRGGQKMSAPLELSRFPIPDYPETAAELSEQVRKNYAELNAELEKALEGVTEAEADHKEGEEWSVKELLAHFIAMERDFQSWAADMLNDTPVEDFLEMRPNVNERLRALVARFQTVPALLEELKRAEAETAALLEALPPRFVARKHLYRRVAQWMLELVPSHDREEHWDQLKTAIAAARKK